MTRLLSGLMLLAIFAFSPSFYQQFYIPKLLVLYAMGVASVIYLATRRRLILPSAGVLLFIGIFLAVAATLGIPSGSPLTSFMQWSFYLGAALLYVAIINLQQTGREFLLRTVFAAALIQLALEATQLLPIRDSLPPALLGHSDHIFGTLGNQEFLATLLGAGFFLGLHFHGQTGDRNKRLLLAGACAALLVGIAFAQNKGALLFIGMYFLWRRVPSRQLFLAIGSAALLAAIFAFPESLKGRALLWLVAATMFAQHFAAGVGLLQFENHYLDVVHGLFSAHPVLSEMLGGHTAMAMDTHNIFLQLGVELGLAGLLLSIAFAIHALRLVKANPDSLGAALLFLLFKCLYTVVLTSITGMIVLVLLLAALSTTRCIELTGWRRLAVSVSALPVVLALAVATFIGASDYHYQQGARLLFMGQNALAVESLNRALTINPGNSDAYLALAQARYLQGDYDGMHNHLANALKYRKNKDTLKIAASMYLHARRYDDAFRLYQFLHETFPQHLTSLTKLASIYMLRGEYDKAYMMARLVLRTVPRSHADSDAANTSTARRIMADCDPFISPALKTTPDTQP
ncbi:MAG TPA: hypothetical protein VFR06_01750 [Gallionellaceae bacterium]|nr:hypothetical protein [Gallionellaceae bacterium]